MFEDEDFQMSLESQLRLRVIEDEIRHCDNVKVTSGTTHKRNEIICVLSTATHKSNRTLT